MDGRDEKEKERNLHKGHRQSMKQRFADSGFSFDGFRPHEVLEILLYYVIPQRNTNDIAHRLIDHFGSLENVLKASPEQLASVKGIKISAARFLKMFEALNRFIQLSRDVPNRLTTVQSMIDFVKPKFSGKNEEMSIIVCLDGNNVVKEWRTVLVGQINYTSVDPRRVLDIALSSNATGIVLAHNHPHGDCAPSVNDIETTKYIRKMLMQVSVKMLDHIIISPEGEYSMLSDPDFRSVFSNK